MIDGLGFEVDFSYDGHYVIGPVMAHASQSGVTNSRIIKINGKPILGHSINYVRALLEDADSVTLCQAPIELDGKLTEVLARKVYDVPQDRYLLSSENEFLDNFTHEPFWNHGINLSGGASDYFVYSNYGGICAKQELFSKTMQSSSRLVDSMCHWAESLYLDGYLEKALSIVNELINVLNSSSPTSNSQGFRLVSNLAFFLRSQDCGEGLKLATVLMKLYSKLHPQDRLQSLFTAATILADAGETEEAISLVKQVLNENNSFLPRYPDEYPLFFRVMIDSGNSGELEQIFKDVLNKRLELHGSFESTVLFAQVDLASVYFTCKDFDKAIILLEEAFDRFTNAVPTESILDLEITGTSWHGELSLSSIMCAVAEHLIEGERFDLAHDYCNKSLNLRRSALGPSHIMMVEPLIISSRIYKSQEKLSSALEQLSAAFEIVCQSGDWRAPIAQKLCATYLEYLQLAGMPEKCKDIEVYWGGTSNSMKPPRTLMRLAQTALRKGNLVDCISHFRNSLDSKSYLSSQWMIRNVQSLSHQLRKREQLILAKEVLEEFLDAVPLTRRRAAALTAIYADLSHVYFSLGLIEQSAECLSRVEDFYSRTSKDFEKHPCGKNQQDPIFELFRTIAVAYKFAGELPAARFFLDQAFASGDINSHQKTLPSWLNAVLDSNIVSAIQHQPVNINELCTQIKTCRKWPSAGLSKILLLWEILKDIDLDKAALLSENLPTAPKSFTCFLQGMTAEAKGDAEAADKLYSMALVDTKPHETMHIRLRLAIMYERVGKLKEAEDLYLELLASFRNTFHLNEGEIHYPWVRRLLDVHKARVCTDTDRTFEILSEIARLGLGEVIEQSAFDVMVDELILTLPTREIVDREKLIQKLLSLPAIQFNFEKCQSLQEALLDCQRLTKGETHREVIALSISNAQRLLQCPGVNEERVTKAHSMLQNIPRLCLLPGERQKFNASHLLENVVENGLRIFEHGQPSLGREFVEHVLALLDQDESALLPVRWACYAVLLQMAMKSQTDMNSVHELFESWLSCYAKIMCTVTHYTIHPVAQVPFMNRYEGMPYVEQIEMMKKRFAVEKLCLGSKAPVKTCSNLCRMYDHMNDSEQALQYAKQLDKMLSTKVSRADLAKRLRQLGHLEEAEEYEQARELKVHDLRNCNYFDLETKAQECIAIGDLAAARIYFEDAVTITIHGEDYFQLRDHGSALYRLAWFHERYGSVQEAKNYWIQLLDIGVKRKALCDSEVSFTPKEPMEFLLRARVASDATDLINELTDRFLGVPFVPLNAMSLLMGLLIELNLELGSTDKVHSLLQIVLAFPFSNYPIQHFGHLINSINNGLPLMPQELSSEVAEKLQELLRFAKP